MYLASVIVGVCFALLTGNALEVTQQERVQYEPKFKKFMKTYNKVYQNGVQHEHRFGIFVENMKKAEDLQKNQLGTAKYGATQFSDLTDSEFRRYLGFNPELATNITIKLASIPNVTLPTNFDWRDKNKVTYVKNQGRCGSCWAFSTTGNIEGLWAIKHNELIAFSEKQLVDCDYYDNGCNGGLPMVACIAILKMGGLEKEKDYPYFNYRTTCAFNKSQIAVKIHGVVRLPKNEEAIAKWLYVNGPVSIGVDSSDMKLYKGGISVPPEGKCNGEMNHAVLLVGFGVSNNISYWIVKNSWGHFWGEDGYYRIHRGSNACSLTYMATTALL